MQPTANAPSESPSPPPSEGGAERQSRIAKERTIIEQAEADIRAGRGIAWTDARQWLIELDQNPAASRPKPSDGPPPQF